MESSFSDHVVAREGVFIPDLNVHPVVVGSSKTELFVPIRIFAGAGCHLGSLLFGSNADCAVWIHARERLSVSDQLC